VLVAGSKKKLAYQRGQRGEGNMKEVSCQVNWISWREILRVWGGLKRGFVTVETKQKTFQGKGLMIVI